MTIAPVGGVVSAAKAAEDNIKESANKKIAANILRCMFYLGLCHKFRQ